jgi:hypothetical protein
MLAGDDKIGELMFTYANTSVSILASKSNRHVLFGVGIPIRVSFVIKPTICVVYGMKQACIPYHLPCFGIVTCCQ